MSERAYHDIMCPSLTKTGPCNCAPVVVADGPLELCGCGCDRRDHDDAGRCLYCSEEDCGGYTYDEEGTLLALSSPVDLP